MDSMTKQEIVYLRELAKKQREYAGLPVMEERKKLWYAHNALRHVRPMVVVEEITFQEEILPKPVCGTKLGRELEHAMLMAIVNHEQIGDDKVTPDSVALPAVVEFRELDHDWKEIRARDESVAMVYEHLVETLADDFHKIKPSVYTFDEAYNRMRWDMAQEAIGDILPIHRTNPVQLEWDLSPGYRTIRLMGMENMMVDMAADPDSVKKLMRFLTEDMERYLDWLEARGLLAMNNGNDYIGAGSYGFTEELRQEGELVTTRNLWGNLNSEECSSISPAMFGELMYPYCERLASRFGLVYYGCCEPMEEVWEPYISRLPNLRSVSVSSWCREEYMGEALRGKPVIYSRKPHPNLLGGDPVLDEEGLARYIRATLDAAKGCEIEFLFRDVYTLRGHLEKPARAVALTREMIDRYYQP